MDHERQEFAQQRRKEASKKVRNEKTWRSSDGMAGNGKSSISEVAPDAVHREDDDDDDDDEDDARDAEDDVGGGSMENKVRTRNSKSLHINEAGQHTRKGEMTRRSRCVKE